MVIHIFGCQSIFSMIIRGYKVLAYFDKQNIVVSKLNEVYLFNIYNGNKELICKFPSTIKQKLSTISTWVRRLLRSDVRYGYLIGNLLILVIDGYFNTYNIKTRKWVYKLKLPRGTRPLNITEISGLKGFEDGLYFGEYFSNPSKEEVHIYKLKENSLECVYTFPVGELNHLHHLIVDVESNCVWILAGDFGNSAAIYRAKEGFRNVEKICFGAQKYRSCVAFPTSKGLVYATDSQYEQNKICLLQKGNDNWFVKDLYDINGPCIYGTQIENKFIFSTSVEAINDGNVFQKYFRNKRGPGIIDDESTIVTGNLNEGFSTVYRNKKDFLPFMLFQFGNILFPSGKNETGHLIFTNIGSKELDFSTVIKKI